MNKKGGGLTHINDITSDEMRVFKAGLKNLPVFTQLSTVKHSTKSVRNYHDKMNYERGFIQHSRSNANQYTNFHFMYGGVRKYIFERYFYNVWYRRNIRNFWFPVLLSYSFYCMTMRMYDNKARDYFYFSD